MDKYSEAVEYYLVCKSIIKTANKYKFGKKGFSDHLKSIGIEVVNYQNLKNSNEDIFETIDSNEKAYWLGFMYADGSLYINEKGSILIELSLAKCDYEHLCKFRKFLEYAGKIGYREKVQAYRISFRSKKMGNDLIKNGCTTKKSLTLKFPSIDIVPEIFLIDFVRGYIDGDGHIGIRKFNRNNYPSPKISIIGTKEFLEVLISRMNWKKLTLFSKNNSESNTYQTQYEGVYVNDMMDTLYANASIYLDRKYKKYLEIKNCR